MVKLSYSCVSLRWGTDPAEYCSYEPLMGLILKGRVAAHYLLGLLRH